MRYAVFSICTWITTGVLLFSFLVVLPSFREKNDVKLLKSELSLEQQINEILRHKFCELKEDVFIEIQK
ncbi:hypothetical protein BpHYR1_040328 [Brachionus plicatilis]|uniref:Uncharacterized protein n=1 Tax=Brachionus plicatilis TaxID=10195 RepID=A0A3M7P3Y0_BRAPC|nr:hypothetical protein BpHYR1_040328 [Brachionus plicatilis]